MIVGTLKKKIKGCLEDGFKSIDLAEGIRIAQLLLSHGCISLTFYTCFFFFCRGQRVVVVFPEEGELHTVNCLHWLHQYSTANPHF